MFPDSKPLTDEQRRGFYKMLGRVFIDFRQLGHFGKTEQVHYLADAFHCLPYWLTAEHFSFSHFRDDFLKPYCRTYPELNGGYFDYLEILDKIEKGEEIE